MFATTRRYATVRLSLAFVMMVNECHSCAEIMIVFYLWAELTGNCINNILLPPPLSPHTQPTDRQTLTGQLNESQLTGCRSQQLYCQPNR